MRRIVNLVEQLAQDMRADRSAAQRPYILVVEDDEADQKLLQMTLDAMGCDVVFVADGQDACQKLLESTFHESRAFDLLFLDLKLPLKDGVEVFREAKKVVPSLPVVIVTGTADPFKIEQCAQMGYVGLVTKPLTKEDMREIMTKHKVLPVRATVTC